MHLRKIAATLAAAVTFTGCGQSGPAPAATSAPPAGSGDLAFRTIAREAIDDFLRRHPSVATDLGVHDYDRQLENLSAAAFAEESKAIAGFKSRVAATDPAGLSLDAQLDRDVMLHVFDAATIGIDVIRQYTKNADMYSGGITNAAYVIMRRPFAPAEERLAALVERETKMPGVLAAARENLKNPPRIYTEIALEQIDGNISFFESDVPAAFKDVTEPSRQEAFKKSNGAVIAALTEYKTFLRNELLPRSNGAFAFGEDTYRKALAANEMIDLPTSQLLEIAEKDRQANEAAFQETAKKIDPSKSADAVLAALQKDHPAPSALLKTTQDTLDSLRQFIVDHHIVTIPPSEPAQVKETPPFMRSTTSASMETPGPFEKTQLEGFYNMTLPDPRWKPAQQADFMRQWYRAAIANVSVHEVYPGHYLQFLYAKQFPSDVRKVYAASSNAEGWAHYCEQMMLDEGFHSDDPSYRLAQLQDALLRDIRFIAGIKMHTQGMTVEQATALFESQGHQPHPVAVSEAKRGTSDALYGYYTMGKLMILKLRDDYKAKMGASYSLQGFHDAFIKLGPLPLPLVRKAMLGETGEVF
jgi:uncharacterized protein (DUF885 family)